VPLSDSQAGDDLGTPFVSQEKGDGAPAVTTAGALIRRRNIGLKLTESLFILPMLICVGALILWPTATAIYHSFFDWQPGYSSPFVGLANYSHVISSSVVHTIALNELVYLAGVPLWVGVPLVVALILYERVPAAGLFRTIFFFPSVLSPVIVGILFNALLRPDGLLNATLKSIGLGGLARSWIDNPSLVKPVIILLVVWFSMGFGVLLYSAALSAVPPELFEAAEIDGATWIQQLRYIMIPSILPMTLLNAIFSVASVFLLFGYVYVLTQGGPGYASTTLDYDIYQQALSYGHFGLAAAESALLLMIMLVILAAAVRIGRRTYGTA
jgi:multiple sugar transport system permease protein